MTNKHSNEHAKEMTGEGQGEGSVFGEPIYCYSRQQAIEDQVLFDVSETARSMGFRIPVALTEAVYCDTVEWDSQTNARKGLDISEDARLISLLLALRTEARGRDGDRITFTHHAIPAGGSSRFIRPVHLLAVCHPGDQMEPVITIMQQWED